MRCLCFFFQVGHNITHGDELVKILIINGKVEFLFAQKDQIRQLKRINTEVVGKLGLEGDLGFLDAQLFHQKIFYLFEH